VKQIVKLWGGKGCGPSIRSFSPRWLQNSHPNPLQTGVRGWASGDPSKGRRDCTLPCLSTRPPPGIPCRRPVSSPGLGSGSAAVARVTTSPGRDLKRGVCTGDSLLFRRAGRRLRWRVTPAPRASSQRGGVLWGATSPWSPAHPLPGIQGAFGETRAPFGRGPGSGEILRVLQQRSGGPRARSSQILPCNGPYPPVL